MKKVTFAALAVAAVAVLNVPVPASAATIKVEYVYSGTVKESGGEFACPAGQVMTGRSHNGDENANTTYQCSWILIDGVQVEVFTGDWFGYMKESNSNFSAPLDQVIVGRRHYGDENGATEYKTGALYLQGRQVRITNRTWTSAYTESGHTTQAGFNQVMTGRNHSGDENGKTQYQYGTVTFAG
ncbi:hypothetical protein ABZU75_21670 [Streptosporangium sp. NPDC005286]|uniref:hypothetical protein n=1 Tax=Streptosporangium sp. NPDC005286 TaxID=3154463 RepID=UPI0033B12FD5